MKKNLFVISFHLSDNSNKKNAGSKALNDINNILNAYGYKIHIITKEPSNIKTICNILSVRKIPKKSHVVIQYPLGNYILTTILVLLILKLKKNKITILIHDLQSLRNNETISTIEIFALNMANTLIAHTDRMKRKLISTGINVPIKILQIFDYLTNSIPDESLKTENEIIFAGNLQKSLFIKDLSKLSLNKYHIALYGLPKIASSANVLYKGSFSPEDLSQIKGSWGLVWDGDSLESCTSFAGEYLRYIAPHKLSMYLAAGLPVIVWKESAEAEFIEKNKLGITVDNLNNIEEILNALPKEKIQIINNNVKNISKKLRNGEMTKHVLDINCKYPNMTYCLRE